MAYDSATLSSMYRQTKIWCEELNLVLKVDEEYWNGEQIHYLSICNSSGNFIVCAIPIEGAYFWIQGYRKGVSK